jgi:hypothetical protein
MGTTIIFRRGENDPTSGSGLTLAEPAFNTTLKTFHIGLGHGITAAWVGAPISGLSADIAAGITYKIPTLAAVKNYIGGLCYGNTGAATITEYVSSFNGLTGDVGGVCAAQTNTFTALQSFTSGISASGITVGGSMTVTGNLTVSGGVTFTASETVLIEDNIITLNSNVTGSPSENAGVEIERGTSANVQLLWNESSDKWTFTNDGSTYYDLPTSVVTSFNGLTGAVQGVSAAVAGTGISVSGATGAVTITNIGVQSFNGLTGAVTGVTVGGANTFTALNSFNAGISSAGATFTNTVWVNSGLIRSSNTGLTLSPSNSIETGSVTTLHIQNANSGLGRVEIRGGDLYLGLKSDGGFPTENITASSIVFEGSQEGDSRVTTLAVENPSANRTVTIPNASGTLALTSQLMGAVNGSTAATTAVTSFNGRTGAVQGVSAAVAGTGISVSGATGAVTITNIGVQSFNGNTGAVTGASLGANTFTALNSFNAGISASGATFSGDIAVNGGDITTTATTATLYNTNATTVTIGSSAGSVTVSSGNTSGMTFGMGFYHKFKTNRVETLTTSQTEIFRFNYKNASLSVVGGLDAAYAEIIITAEKTPGFGACSGTQITKLLIASNPADGTVFHTEYGNVNTNGNLASYTASISGNDVIIYATPTSSDYTIFKVLATLIRGEFGEGI